MCVCAGLTPVLEGQCVCRFNSSPGGPVCVCVCRFNSGPGGPMCVQV